MFLDLGRKLLSQGKKDEAMAMFDASIPAFSTPLNDSLESQLQWGEKYLLQKPSADIQPLVDTYHEDECDVGPRVLDSALVPEKSTGFDLLYLIVCYNKALVHHARKEGECAWQLYDTILGAINLAVSTNTATTHMCHLAVRTHNNMGEIEYSRGSKEVAIHHFQKALVFFSRLNDPSDSESLDYANVLSNWCRVHWKLEGMSADLFGALEEVLHVRFSILGWDHIDVASAHFNLGRAEYSRQRNDKAMSHLMQYLQVASHRLKRNIKPELDPIPGVISILLIKNGNKNDKTSQDLVWGLRTLQDKRKNLGPINLEVASILNFIGTLLFNQRELEHALLFFQEELRQEEQLVGCNEGVSISVTCNNIGRILQELGRFPQAIHYYQRSLKQGFGDVLSKVEDYKRTEQNNNCKRVISDVCDKSNTSLATMNLYSTVWYNLGLIHDKNGAYMEAIKAFQMSLKLRQAMLGNDHADVGCLLYNIGVLQMDQQLLKEAARSLREALRIRRVTTTCRLNDYHIVKTLQKLAFLHKSKGYIREALEACKDVIEILKISVDFEWTYRNRNMGTTLRDIAELYHAEGNVEMALQAALGSVRILRTCREARRNSSDSCRVLEETAIMLQIGSLLHERCDPLEARRTFSETAHFIQSNITGALDVTSDDMSKLVPLLEVCTMLASAHCAPEA